MKIELLNKVNDNKLLAMNEEEFNKWVASFVDVSMNLEEHHKLEHLIARYHEIHDDYNERTKTLNEDYILAKALGLSGKDFENDYSNVDSILPLLDENYYTSLKPLNIVQHQAFPGIPDLGSPIMGYRFEEFNIKKYDELVKAVGMMHGPKLYDANYDWLIVDANNPSLSDCVCFKEEADALDVSDINNAEFKLNMGYIPSKEWIELHTKIIVAIAKVYLNEPLRYYKAYVSLHKDKLTGIDFNKNLKKQMIPTKDIELETMFIVLTDLVEHGYKYEDVGINKE